MVQPGGLGHGLWSQIMGLVVPIWGVSRPPFSEICPPPLTG